MSFSDVKTRAKIMKPIARKKDAPHRLKVIYKKMIDAQKTFKKLQKQLKEHKKTVEYKAAMRKKLLYERQIRHWQNEHTIYIRMLGLYTDDKIHIPPVVSYHSLV